MANIKVGDRVQYSRNWLRSTGNYTGRLPFAKGIVTSIKNYGGLELATINWGDPDIPERVNIKNLHKIGSLEHNPVYQYELIEYDVWGNEEDGWNVNQAFHAHQYYFVDTRWDDKILIQELKKQGLIKKGVKSNLIGIEGDDYAIYFDYNGKPEFELRRKEKFETGAIEPGTEEYRMAMDTKVMKGR